MGWFTSNLSGQPHLYPTKKDYEKQHLDEETQNQKRKQPHLYPLRHEYSSKTALSKEQQNQKSHNQKHQAKYILQRLNMKSLSVIDLLSIIEGQHLACKMMGKQVQKCLEATININKNDYVNDYCKNDLSQYRECLKNTLNYEQSLF